MPFVQRYSDVKKGAIIFAGNTLGLSKAANSNSPGTEGWRDFSRSRRPGSLHLVAAGGPLYYLHPAPRKTLRNPAKTAAFS